MIPKDFKRPEIVEITDEKGWIAYIPTENEIEISSDVLSSRSKRIFIRHELVHALDKYKGRLNGLKDLFMSEIRAYYYMFPKKIRKLPKFPVVYLFIPFPLGSSGPSLLPSEC